METSEGWLLYGAYGYTGRLIAEEARARGLRPILAGRDASRLRSLAEKLGLPWRAFDLSDEDEIARNLSGAALALHAAGPYSATSGPMACACLRARAHYLDLTGEIPVIEAVLDRHAQARERGIVMIPGVGCDVVPSNCLAALLAEKLPGGLSLELACAFKTVPSRGTLKTVVEQIPLGGRVVRGGRTVPVRHGAVTRRFSFSGRPPATVMAAPWGDLVAAQRASKIPDITVYMLLPRWMILYAQAFGGLSFLLGLPGVPELLKTLVGGFAVEGGDEDRRSGWLIWAGELRDGAGRVVKGEVSIPDPYLFTAQAALAAVDGVLRGDVEPGAWTPAQAFGSGFVAGLSGVTISI